MVCGTRHGAAQKLLPAGAYTWLEVRSDSEAELSRGADEYGNGYINTTQQEASKEGCV